MHITCKFTRLRYAFLPTESCHRVSVSWPESRRPFQVGSQKMWISNQTDIQLKWSLSWTAVHEVYVGKIQTSDRATRSHKWPRTDHSSRDAWRRSLTYIKSDGRKRGRRLEKPKLQTMLKLQAYNFILCQKSHFVLYGCETRSLDKWKGHGLGALKKNGVQE